MKRGRWLIASLAALLLATAWSPAPQEGGTTENPSNVVVSQLYIFITRSGDRLQVGEYYLIGNMGEQTYIGVEDPQTGRRATLTFTMPEGAGNLNFDGPGLGERFLPREGGFADTEPVPPASVTVEVLFSYELPYQEGLRLERTFSVPVASVVLVVSEGMALEGAGLSSTGPLDTQMGSALSYTTGPLAAGDALAFTVTTAPETPSASLVGGAPVRNAGREVAIGLAALAAAMASAYLLWRPGGAGPIPAHIHPLVERIAALDEAFEAGERGEEVYRAERERLKRRIRTLLERGPMRNDRGL